jgi:hypothetical protein
MNECLHRHKILLNGFVQYNAADNMEHYNALLFHS